MKAVYPGSFDPITYGHVDLVRRSLSIADSLIVGVLANTNKRPLFTLEERVDMVRRSFKGLKRVDVQPFDGLLVDFLRRK